MTLSNWIDLFTLFVVVVYTMVTYFLLHQQKIQFELSNRPWVYAGDICYNERGGLQELGVILLNTGKIPAQCNVLAHRISITQPFGEKVELLNKDEVRDFPIFPYVDGADFVHMFLFSLTEEQDLLFTENSRIESQITVNYSIPNKESKTRYRYEAELTVEHLNQKAGKQTTLIKVSSAT